jgi:CheY-like chemotaxis protein
LRIFCNLLQNANKSAPAAPVRVQLARAGDRLRIVFADRGPGISVRAGETAFIRRVRALGTARGGGEIPALALTAFAGEEDRRRALSAGFQMHLAKPVDMDHLTQAVADLSHRPTAASADVGQAIASVADPVRR